MHPSCAKRHPAARAAYGWLIERGLLEEFLQEAEEAGRQSFGGDSPDTGRDDLLGRFGCLGYSPQRFRAFIVRHGEVL